MNNTQIKNPQKIIAVLAASGLHEADLTDMQKAAQKLNMALRIISMDQGLLSSWNSQGWGLSYAVDGVLNQALAADYEALLIPGGQRSTDKLQMTAHTKRFIGGFIENEKPVVAVDDGIALLAFSEKITGRMIAAPDAMKDTIEAAGAQWSASHVEQDGKIMSFVTTRNEKPVLSLLIEQLLSDDGVLKKAA